MRAYTLFVLIGLWSTTIVGQANIQTQGYMSPTAASLGKYGDMPISEFTGRPSLAIPLTELKSINLSVPISLSYSSSGFRPDERPGWVGLGWSLQAGGVITRTMKGFPDEQADHGYLATEDDIYDYNPVFMENVSLGQKDGEPDVFYFNFMGYAGKFVLGREKDGVSRILTIPQHDFEITYHSHTSINYDGQNFHYKPIIKWVIVTPGGTKYIFEETEITVTNNADSQGVLIFNTEKIYTSSWYLSEIQSPQDTIRFTYKRHNPSSPSFQKFRHETQLMTNSNVLSYSYHETYSKRIDKIITAVDSVQFHGLVRSDFENEQYLSHIEVFKNDHIINNFTFDMGYFGNSATNKQLKLKGVDIMGSTMASPKQYKMLYHDELSMPNRETLGIDLWGYYNGNNNNNTLLPELAFLDGSGFIYKSGSRRYPSFNHNRLGMLREITYPTGGKSILEYEQNDYGYVEDELLNHRSLGESDSETLIWYRGMPSGSIPTLTLTDSAYVDVQLMCEQGESCFDNYPEFNPTFSLLLPPGEYDLTDFAGALTGPTSEFDINNNLQGMIVYRYIEWVNFKYGGGLRIKSVTDSDGFGEVNERQFNYRMPDNENISSGVVLREPVFFYLYAYGGPCAWFVRSASSVYQLGSLSGSSVGYSYVTTTYADGGQRVQRFLSPITSPEMEQPSVAPIGHKFGPPRFAEFAYGYPLSVFYKDASGKKLSATVYEYKIYMDNLLSSPQIIDYSYPVSRGLNMMNFGQCNGTSFAAITYYDHNYGWINKSKETSIVYGNADSTVTTKEYEYSLLPKQLLTKSIETNSNEKIRETVFEYAHQNHQPGMANLNMLTQPYSVTVTDGNGAVLSKNWTLWKDWGNGKWLPCEVWAWNGGAPTPPANCSSN
ncbi:MAG: hypothetical protein WC967_14655 [Balneolaceae bacterium]